jgi:hypothetical protein
VDLSGIDLKDPEIHQQVEMSGGSPGALRVEFSTYNTVFGHAALRLEFLFGEYGYIDNGWFGGENRIFL